MDWPYKKNLKAIQLVQFVLFRPYNQYTYTNI